MNSSQYYIVHLCLARHPEGGYFKETYRSPEVIEHTALPERFTGERSFSTGIYYLLEGDGVSYFHRIKQDELWHFYDGTGLTIHIISSNGTYSCKKLGLDFMAGEEPQVVVPRGSYFAAEVTDKTSFAFVGCTVAPGFDFDDFEIPARGELCAKYPKYEAVINAFTR